MTEVHSNSKSAKLFIERIWSKLTISLRNSIPQIVAVLAAFLIGAIILFATGHSPLEAYGALLTGAFGDIYGI